jgi:hypothetical protein
MSFEEYQNWLKFFNQRPEGWREDSRIYQLMRVQGCKQPGSQLFHSLALMQRAGEERPKNATDSLKGSFLFSKLLGAQGGDSLEILQEL